MIEVADFEVLENDGRRAVIEFRVWDGERIAPVRCVYRLGAVRLFIECAPRRGYTRAEHFVAHSKECLADAREALAYQRDLNKEKN